MMFVLLSAHGTDVTPLVLFSKSSTYSYYKLLCYLQLSSDHNIYTGDCFSRPPHSAWLDEGVSLRSSVSATLFLHTIPACTDLKLTHSLSQLESTDRAAGRVCVAGHLVCWHLPRAQRGQPSKTTCSCIYMPCQAFTCVQMSRSLLVTATRHCSPYGITPGIPRCAVCLCVQHRS